MKANFDRKLRVILESGDASLLRMGGLGLGWLGIGQPILAAGAGSPAPAGPVGHLASPGRRAQPARDLGPEARCPVRSARTVRVDRDPLSRRSDFRASAAPGRADGSAGDRSIGSPRRGPDPRDWLPASPDRRLCRAGDDAPTSARWSHISRGARNGLPASVLLPGPIRSTGIDIPHGQSSGWLGTACDPFSPGTARMAPTSSASSVLARREPARVNRASTAQGNHRSTWPPSRKRLRDEYGRTSFGQSCLLARRLVEAGVRVVTVNMFQTVFNQITWDCHGAAPFSTLDDYARVLLPDLDRAFAALIDDLDRRGRLESTLVVAAGEFGRTPRINSSGGRDHWPGVWSIAMAGGGIRAGQVVGASDAERRLSRRPARHAPGHPGVDVLQPGHRCQPVSRRPRRRAVCTRRKRPADPRALRLRNGGQLTFPAVFCRRAACIPARR